MFYYRKRIFREVFKKMIYLKHALFLICFFWFGSVKAIPATTTVSLLTCDKGKELYSTFGHSAIRINAGVGKDVVYDFGVFDFKAPNFIYHFLKGDLEYRLERRTYSGFEKEYEKKGRAIVEQDIHLTPEETQLLFQLLQETYKSEARFYRYNFLHDNCSTRIRDLLVKVRPDAFEVNDGALLNNTYRDHLKLYLADSKWLELGIDILLGAPTDQKMTLEQEMFLPQPLSFQLAELPNGNGFVDRGNYAAYKPLVKPGVFSSPFVLLTLLMAVILVVVVKTGKAKKTILSLFLLLLGLVGVVLLLMWKYSLHEATWQNANLIWANPFYLLFPVFLFNRFHKYFLIFVMAINALFIVFCGALTQYFNPAIYPVVVFVIVLSFLVYKATKKEKNVVNK